MYQRFICRVCAATETTCILVNIFEKLGAQQCVADILLELTGVKTAVDDGFPQQCCSQCQTDLVHAVSVRRKCIESDKLFRTCIKSCLFLTDEQHENQSYELSNVSSNSKYIPLEKNPIYRCCECSMDFFDSEALQEHYKAMHANMIHGWESIGVSEISLFDTTDDEGKAEDEVLNNSSKVENTIHNNPAHRCCGCKARFDTEIELFHHSEAIHVPKAMKINENQPFQCDVCYHTFSTTHGAKEHQAARCVLRYQCAICGILFSRLHQCRAHESTHIDHKHICDVCGKKFSNIKYYKRHKKMIHSDPVARERFVCSICGTSVLSASYLKTHMQLHSEEYPYSCDLCGACFKIPAYLNWHVTRHKGLYTCQRCGLTFKGPSDLQEHMNCHREARNYGCTLCPARFRIKKSLEKHLKNVHAPNKRKRK